MESYDNLSYKERNLDRWINFRIRNGLTRQSGLPQIAAADSHVRHAVIGDGEYEQHEC